MEEKLVNNYNIKPFLESCKPLLINSNTLYAKSEEINVKCCKKSKKSSFLANTIIVSFSIMTFIVMWFTDTYNQLILQSIVLRNDSNMLSWWLKPPVVPIVKVHIFNYTNIDRFLNGSDEKIKIQEIGPYSYREPVEKVNLRFENDKISFNENRSHTFVAELSGANLTENDVIHVPNIPFISAIPNVKKMGFLAEIGFRTILGMTKPQQFQNLDVRKFLFGYNDDYMDAISKIRWDFRPEEMGILSPRHGLSKQRITVNLGLNDVENTAKVEAIDGKSRHNFWNKDYCNNIGGSDGTLYGPRTISKKEDLHVYLPEICRSLPMKYVKKSDIYGLPSYYYTSYLDIFSSAKNTSHLEYNCEEKSLEDPIDGLLDVSDCIEGTPPVAVSYAHFMEGDSRLFEKFEGLHPEQRERLTPYAHIHPRIGMPFFGMSRLQLNIRVTSFGRHYEKFNGLVLPLVWVETTLEEFQPWMKSLLYLSTYGVDCIEILLKFGSILSFFISSYYLIKKFVTF